MPWFRADDGLSSSRKVLGIPRSRRAAAMGLWVLAGTWCSRELTDGFIGSHMFARPRHDLGRCGMSSVHQRIRFKILHRDDFTCRYCGTGADGGAVLEIDHVVPRALGGSDDPDNLVTACRECNSGKSAMRLDDPVTIADVDEVKVRAARAAGLYAAATALGQCPRCKGPCSWDSPEQCASVDGYHRGFDLGVAHRESKTSTADYLVRFAADVFGPEGRDGRERILYCEPSYALEQARVRYAEGGIEVALPSDPWASEEVPF